MTSGLNQNIGAQYQHYVGVLRVLDMLSERDLVEIKFEEIDKETEDIIIRYNDYTIHDQAKKNEQGHWSPSNMGDILRHFYDTWQKLGFKDDIRFRFTTNTGPNTEMREIDRMFKATRQDFSQVDFNLPESILRKFPDSIPENELVGFAKRTEFDWNVGAIRDVDNPIEGIRKNCQMELSLRTEMELQQVENKIDKLVIEVMNKTQDRSHSRLFTRRTLQEILPGYVNIDKELQSLSIPQIVVDEIIKLNPLYCSISQSVSDSGERYIPSALIKIGKRCFAIWIVSVYTIQDEIELIDRVVKSAKDLKHIIILDGSIDSHAFGEIVRPFIVSPENPKRVAEIVGER